MDEAEELCDRVAVMEAGKFIVLDTPVNLIDKLVARGFKRSKEVKQANLEDVFLDLTGREWRDE
jgi:ABC-2 type transport system ATP-binding protein